MVDLVRIELNISSLKGTRPKPLVDRSKLLLLILAIPFSVLLQTLGCVSLQILVVLALSFFVCFKFFVVRHTVIAVKNLGTSDETRTRMPFLTGDFKSPVYTVPPHSQILGAQRETRTLNPSLATASKTVVYSIPPPGHL